jgi:V8-like Glu-specific endopeptidase
MKSLLNTKETQNGYKEGTYEKFKVRRNTILITSLLMGVAGIFDAKANEEGEYWVLGEKSQEVLDYTTKEIESYEVITDVDAESDAWTDEDYKNAQPVQLPEAINETDRSNFSFYNDMSSSNDEESVDSEASVESEGQAPSVRIRPNFRDRLFIPDRLEKTLPKKPDVEQSVEKSKLEPYNVSPIGAHYTSSRLVPLQSDLSYPYKAVGKLFFKNHLNQPFLCSATVIKPRIILTAAHCVKSDGRFQKNWQFVPAYRRGSKPFGVWNATAIRIPVQWVRSEVLPHPTDYAVIELKDKIIQSKVTRLGDVTGWLGYKTNALFPNHATLLGYPGNFDSGELIHQVNSESFAKEAMNTAIYGSDMGQGSSGGPWVENFGTPSIGQSRGTGMNRIIGVTSYGAGLDFSGSSVLDARFVSILNEICSRQNGNCK